jgi:hypothetical protein
MLCVRQYEAVFLLDRCEDKSFSWTRVYMFEPFLVCVCPGGSYFHDSVSKFSRRIGFATIIFWGRFLIPVPFRVPLVGVTGSPIRVEKVTFECILMCIVVLLSPSCKQFKKNENLFMFSFTININHFSSRITHPCIISPPHTPYIS